MRHATITLAILALFAGCHNYEYVPVGERPRYVLMGRYSAVNLRIQSQQTKPALFNMKLGDFQRGLNDSYRRVNAPFDVATVKAEWLKELKAEYHSMRQTWLAINREVSAIKREDARLELSLDYQMHRQQQTIDRTLQLLDRIESRLVELDEQVAVYNERYAVDRQRYILKKNKYREHLLKGLAANGVRKDHIYSDDRVIIYVDSLKVRQDSATLTIKAYIADPCLPLGVFHRWPGSGFRPPPESVIFAYNARGDSMGSPIDVTRVEDPEVKGVTLTLTYQDDTEAREGHVKLILGKGVLSNKERVTLEAPYSLQEVGPPALPSKTATSPPPKTEKDFVGEIQTITCRREGDHLAVPVSLSIHGKSVDARMLLDTGASVTTVPLTLYRQGNAKALSDLRRETFSTANGMIQCYVDTVQVSTSAYSKTSLIALSDHDIPLLGANYFQGTVFTVDVENECIYVHPRGE